MAGSLVISNTTPLINFAEIGRLDVLLALFGTLIIPPAVRDELEAKRSLFPRAAQVPAQSGIVITSPQDHLLVKELTTRVHGGEAECLALSMENSGSLLLRDDLTARELASTNVLLYTGTLGCLAEAKRKGILPAIEPVLRDIQTKARFWITETLTERVLRAAGER